MWRLFVFYKTSLFSFPLKANELWLCVTGKTMQDVRKRLRDVEALGFVFEFSV